MMANGELVKILIHTDVTRYIEFKDISGSYVASGEKIYKVPASEQDALTSSLMGMFEKRRLKNFLEFLQKWNDSDPTTHQGIIVVFVFGFWFLVLVFALPSPSPSSPIGILISL